MSPLSTIGGSALTSARISASVVGRFGCETSLAAAGRLAAAAEPPAEALRFWPRALSASALWNAVLQAGRMVYRIIVQYILEGAFLTNSFLSQMCESQFHHGL